MKYSIIFLASLVFIGCSESKKEFKGLTTSEVQRISNLNTFDELFDITELKLNTEEINLPAMSSSPKADVNGNIYLICENQEIYKFNKFGNYLNCLKKIGRGPGEYININRIYVDSFENVFVDDPGNLQILIYDKNFEFKNKIEKETEYPFSRLIRFKKDYLIGFSPNNKEHPLFIYNLENSVLEEKTGVPNKDMRKLSVYISGDGMEIDGNSIYYIFSEQYQIFRNTKGAATELLDFIPSYFKSPDKKLNSISEMNGRKFPISSFIFAEDKLLFLGIREYVFGSNRGYNFDIFSKDGELIKSELPFKVDSPIIKYAPKKYISYKHNEEENDYTITIILMEYKY